MARGRWTPSEENLAAEAYSVLIRRKKASRTYSKDKLLVMLARPGISTYFLKLCLEWDDSSGLTKFRRGLLLCVQARGATRIAQKIGVSRVTLYRMLGPAGNPRLSSLIPLLRHLGVRLWVVDDEFIARRGRAYRPKEQPFADLEEMAIARARMMEYPGRRNELLPEENEDD